MRKRTKALLLDQNQAFTTVIRSDTGIFDIHFSELFRYWDLVIMLFRRNIMLQYKQTALGMMWLFLYPILTSFVFTFVFGSLAGFSTDGVPSFLFYLASNSLWWVFANCLSNIARTYQSDGDLFKKVYFPRLAPPLGHMLTGLFSFAIRMGLIFIVYFVVMLSTHSVNITWRWLLLPIPVLQAAILGLACGIIITSMTAKYRDMALVADFGVQLLMYATPVIYTFSSMRGFIRAILLCNPMTAVMENFRYLLFGVGQPMIGAGIVSWIVTLLLAVFGIIYYSNVCKTCIDTI